MSAAAIDRPKRRITDPTTRTSCLVGRMSSATWEVSFSFPVRLFYQQLETAQQRFAELKTQTGTAATTEVPAVAAAVFPLRGAAQARVAGRTNKTPAGARRQTIVTSVLESLRLYLQTFTLSRVVAEVQRWGSSGRSCFARLLRRLHLSLPEPSVMERVLPVSSG